MLIKLEKFYIDPAAVCLIAPDRDMECRIDFISGRGIWLSDTSVEEAASIIAKALELPTNSIDSGRE